MVTCPADERLRLYLEEMARVPESTLAQPAPGDSLMAHVEACPACQQRLDQLLLVGCRGESASTEADDHAAQALVQRLLASPPPPTAGPASPSYPDIPGYELIEELGRGGMSVVYKARDRKLRRLVAIKRMLHGLADSPRERERFRREAEAIARLSHRNIVRIHEVGEAGGVPHLCLEFCDGGSLAHALQGTPLAAEQATALVETLARAVEYAHLAGIVHRDLKPGNVLLTRRGSGPLAPEQEQASRLLYDEAKITDFGLAKWLDEPGQSHTGAPVGTPSYMPPEQARGERQAIGPASDVYALGAILYECLTGRPPFRAPTAVDTLLQVVRDDPVPPRQLQPKVPVDLETVCLKCLEKAQASRYASAAELADELGRFRAGQPVRARPLSYLQQGIRWARRHPLPAWLLLLYFLGLGGAASVFAFLAVRAERHAAAEQVQRQQADHYREQAEQARDDGHTLLQRLLLMPLREFAGRALPPELVVELSRMPPARWGWECDRRELEVGLGPWPRRVVGTHDWGVLALLLSPDGRFLLSSGDDGRLVRWELSSGKGRDLRGGSWDEERRRWRPPAWMTNTPLEPWGEDTALALAWLAPGKSFLAATLGGRLLLHDAERGDEPREILSAGPGCPLTCLAVASYGRRIAAGDQQGWLHSAAPDGTRRWRLWLGPSPVVAVEACPRGGWVVAQEDGAVHLLDPTGDRIVHRVREPAGVGDVALAPEGTVLVVGRRAAWYRIEAGGTALALADIYQPRRPEGGVPLFEKVRVGATGAAYLTDAAGQLTVVPVSGPAEAATYVVCRRDRPPPTSGPLPLRRRAAAVIPSPDERSLFLAGRGALVAEWSLELLTGRTRFRIDGLTGVCFDPGSPGLLWAGTADGQVKLVDSRNGAELFSRRIHDKAVTVVEPSPTGDVVTAGADGMVRTLRRRGETFAAVGKPIRHARPLRALAVGVRRDGEALARRIAATDCDDNLIIWDGATGRRLAGRCLRDEKTPGPALSGKVAYNSSGTQLAVLGPGATCWLFESDDLSRSHHPPNVVSGAGGTALRWNPKHPDVLVAADGAGRVHLPRDLVADVRWRALPQNPGFSPRPDFPVRALGWSPDGQRLAAASRDRVLLFEPLHVGLAWQDRLGPGEPVFAGFDPTGHRLAVAQRGGAVTVWETGLDRFVPPGAADEPASRIWHEATLLSAEQARGLIVPDQAPSAAFDSRGRLGVLYSRPENGPKGQSERVFRLGLWDGKVFDTGQVVVRLPDNSTSANIAGRACALFVQGERFHAACRVPQAALAGGNGGDLFWFDAQTGEGRLVGSPGNHWFYLHPLAAPDGSVAVAHYCHNRGELLVSRRQPDGWTTRAEGRCGDGFRLQAVAGSDGRMHVVFRPMPWAGTQPLTYLGCVPGEPGRTVREVVDDSHSPESAVITIGPADRPVVLFSRVARGGHRELVLSTREASGWQPQVVLDRLPGNWLKAGVGVCGLVCDVHGCYHALLTIERGRRQTYWLSGRGSNWEVRALPRAGGRVSLHLNHEGRPTVLASVVTPDGPTLRLFTLR